MYISIGRQIEDRKIAGRIRHRKGRTNSDDNAICQGLPHFLTFSAFSALHFRCLMMKSLVHLLTPTLTHRSHLSRLLLHQISLSFLGQWARLASLQIDIQTRPTEELLHPSNMVRTKLN